ncbi:SNF2 family helicase [Turbot reddish body iridovirus]|uniref:SNF2 family helicase n=1 Tax=Turbot reddish body iridovirus TaxID=273651 RepID=E2CU03_ISKNV|nr:SNF2 family helicase [Turbot reddish body iridovirus]
MDVLLSLYPSLSDRHFSVHGDIRLTGGIDPTDDFVQQQYLARFLSPETPYNELLLFHEMGTGKTCTAVAIAQCAAKYLKGVLVITRGEGLMRNFQSEIMNKCQSVWRRERRSIEQFFHFETYDRFATWCGRVSRGVRATKYKNHLVIVDEVHNLREDNASYRALLEFMHTVQGAKKVLLSGTPMSDRADEIIDVMNLILPQDAMMDKAHYFSAGGVFVDGRENEFMAAVRGRVSFVLAKDSGVRVVYAGAAVDGLPFNVVQLAMRKYQRRAYRRAVREDAEANTIFTSTRKASLAAMPAEGQLVEYSVKYDYVLRSLQQARKAFVYCDVVRGTGVMMLADILQQNGWHMVTSSKFNGVRRAKRFIVLTGAESARAHKMLERFNHERNVDGSDISLVIGSRAVAEGFTMRDVTDVLVLTPHWNFTETFQAIYRAVRARSHEYTRTLLGESDPQVTVHMVVALCSDESLDLNMLRTAMAKDVQIKRVEYMLKVSAVDCAFMKARNMRRTGDGSRECQYTACEYRCKGQRTAERRRRHFIPVVPSERARLNAVQGSSLIGWGEEDVPQLWYMWVHRVPVRNFSGHIAYMVPSMINGNSSMLVTTDPYATGLTVEDEYYSNHFVCSNEHAFTLAQLCERRDARAAPRIVTRILDGTDGPECMLRLPRSSQLKVLKALVQMYAEHKALDEHQSGVLDMYGGFWDPESYQLWLYEADLVLQRSDATGMLQWGTDPAKRGTRRKQELMASPVGYYGMYNPARGDFCIRDVRGAADGGDMRRLKVGQRCVDMDKWTLLHLLVTRLKPRDVPDSHRSTRRLMAMCMDIARAQRAHSVIHNFVPADRQEAVLFMHYVDMSREQLCKIIKRWMRRHGLLEHNFECGHAFKHRT